MDAKTIRSQMSARGVSVQQLARATGISYQRLWNKLNGRTALTAEDLQIIANSLGVSSQSLEPKAEAPREAADAPVRSGETRGRMDATGKRFAIVVSRWNELVTKELLEGALDELRRHGDPAVEVIHVPGTWEMPVAIKALFERGRRPQAVLALGCIMQGQTAHAGLLGGDVGAALMSLQVSYGVPIAWGVLTPDSQDQALDRAGLKMGNKGREAAQAAIEMAALVEAL
jgi:6,7-dimethyl-8-ribityllumazine synthase